MSPAPASVTARSVTGMPTVESVSVYETKLDWQNDAACKDKPIVLFVPDIEQPRERDYAAGVAYCRECPVRVECLNYAMEYEQDQRYRFGVFGGMTPHERSQYETKWVQRR